jgi:hypothetical protein
MMIFFFFFMVSLIVNKEHESLSLTNTEDG